MSKHTVEVMVGKVGIGGINPVRIQSMTNTLTADVEATVEQIIELHEAGSEIVRFTVKDEDDAQAVPHIRKRLVEKGCDVPIVGDFHYNGHLLLTKYPDCAQSLDKFRINPGNVGSGEHHDQNFVTFIEQAIKYDKPIRIGVNAGSKDESIFERLLQENAAKPSSEQKTSQQLVVDTMVVSALESVKMAERIGLPHNKIVLSVKVSKAPEMIAANRQLSALTDLPLHLGVTEAGMGIKGAVASTAGLSVLLAEGIGDTIRTSLTPSPGSSRTEEVIICQQVLQFLGMRHSLPTVTSCPGCGRTNSSVFQEIAKEITDYLLQQTPVWKKKGYRGFEMMVVAVMGCIVNGPGESKDANIGLCLPGTGENSVSPVYADGKKIAMLSGSSRIADFKQMIEEYVESHYRV
ncbi:MAG: 4-hydroxy-3-methylbut-2-en-1-yl diphosphate synthase [Candidatus Electronema aureum]|uniref:4-hydroxy-3-methylbut-2-en-1-yl diphosphate synthase (flavodoxin) n=1 Tax=Candidatus Electronema aureum TaxID=2005002 RepID=A0A521G5K8_9BACT|nr:MAG: 4-hydroxy-3-methylbut-2-en-1-yl diphosphate synthase [Candidatus Electronema aureum]